jgi:hypothetical protein
LYLRFLTPAEATYTDQLYTEFSDEFENIYIQCKADRLPMARQSIHSGSHNASETTRLGPLMNVSQWTMERVIGQLVEAIRSDVEPFANLGQIARRQCQINALISVIPDLDYLDAKKRRPAKWSVDAGLGYFLLPPADRTARVIQPADVEAIRRYFEREGLIVPAGWKCPPVR